MKDLTQSLEYFRTTIVVGGTNIVDQVIGF